MARREFEVAPSHPNPLLGSHEDSIFLVRGYYTGLQNFGGGLPRTAASSARLWTGIRRSSHMQYVQDGALEAFAAGAEPHPQRHSQIPVLCRSLAIHVLVPKRAPSSRHGLLSCHLINIWGSPRAVWPLRSGSTSGTGCNFSGQELKVGSRVCAYDVQGGKAVCMEERFCRKSGCRSVGAWLAGLGPS
jgi:hypothetical protein